jgi:DNA replication and repair protein RecF
LAEKLDSFRAAYVVELKQSLIKMLAAWNLDVELGFDYRRGWRTGETLRDQLQTSLAQDRKKRFTSAGPHRADLVLKSANLRSGRRLSRGQLKMLAVALHFAQSQLILERSGVAEILLFDDLSAELDKGNRELLLNEIAERFHQSFITALSPEDLSLGRHSRHMFHVEHGVFDQP